MGVFDAIEKLITEHGSAAILRERIALARDEYAALQKQATDLQAENQRLKSQNAELREQLKNLPSAVQSSGYVCDHCGSPKLRRTGNRPDPTFGEVGIKQAVFTCEVCGRESGFTQDP